MLNLRSLDDPADDEVVRDIFWSTIRLGGRLDAVVRLRRYEELCLGWYLGPERALVRLLCEGGRPVGYVLLGTRRQAHRRWQRRRAVMFALTGAAALAAQRHDPSTARFVRLRLIDGWTLRSSPVPMAVHVHLNLLPSARAGRGARLLVDHVDAVCRRLGEPGWFGEVNAPVGRRAAALGRVGLEVVHRAPNRTLSSVLQQPVERLTVVRSLPMPRGAAA